ncbi:MAG: outer membrane lipoprotein chaperone LolA [Lysobacteraceae bacterium]
MRLFRLLLPALLGLACAAQAASPVERFNQGLHGLDGRFVQTVYDEQGVLRERSEGSVSLAAPRLFRWEYEQPFPQTIVADGDHVWIHDPDLEQVSVRRQALEEQSSPLAVLIDPAELDRQFDREDLGMADGLHWVRLTPKLDDGALTECRIGFDGDALATMLLVDQLGQRTEIAFSHWRRNPQFERDHFRFEPPPGTDVVGEQIERVEVRPLAD